MKKDITVVIPTINGREALLRRAVQSVQNQTLPTNLIVELDDDRQGAAYTRNKALKRVTSTWTVFLDDDDELLPDHALLCLATAIINDADLVYPYPNFIGGPDPLATAYQGNVVSPFGVPFGPEQAQWLRRRGNFIPITYIVKTEHVKAVGGFPEPWQFPCEKTNISNDCEDFGLLLALLNYGTKFHHLPKKTWNVHIHDDNTGGKW